MSKPSELSDLQEFGARLRATRDAYGISQFEIAKALGVDMTTVGRYEAGTRVMDYPTVRNFIVATEVTADWLFFGYLDFVPSLLRRVLQADNPELVRERPRELKRLEGKARPRAQTVPSGDRSSTEFAVYHQQVTVLPEQDQPVEADRSQVRGIASKRPGRRSRAVTAR